MYFSLAFLQLVTKIDRFSILINDRGPSNAQLLKGALMQVLNSPYMFVFI